jgi:hypothetical protein
VITLGTVRIRSWSQPGGQAANDAAIISRTRRVRVA